MARRPHYRKRKAGPLDLIALVLLLLAGWWTRNVGGLTSLFIVMVLLVVGYFVIRLWLAWRARNRLAASGIAEVDRMSGAEFERFVGAHLRRKGYRVKETPSHSDYGGDLVLQKDGRSVVVQAKRWNGAVGVRAVQEVLGAINYYGADKGLVVTNSDFTENAYELARRSPVELWNRQKLTESLLSVGEPPDDPSPETSPWESSDSRTCPRCGRTLVVRSGRRGSFWGCTGFPGCRYTTDL